MDRRTVDVYEANAADYANARSPRDPDRARAFAAALPPRSLRLDLGSGPGLYLPLLGTPVAALDASTAMLGESRKRAPGALLVQADLEALPFRRGAFGGVWANKCLQHVRRDDLPLALAEVHRVIEVGGRLEVLAFTGDGDRLSDDDLPGRRFALWDADEVIDLLVGAGFDVGDVQCQPPGRGKGWTPGTIAISALRARTLADTVDPGMRLLLCGLNPSPYAADAGVGFARPGNRFWPAMHAAGLATIDRDARRLLRDHGIGMTDLVKRATRSAAEVTPAEYGAGMARVRRLCARLQPAAICFVGLSGWRSAVDRRATAGWQPSDLAGVPVYVMPNPSGANAHATPAIIADHLRAAATGSLARQPTPPSDDRPLPR